MAKVKVERIPLTDDQKKAIASLARCTFLPGSFEKRFARDMASQVEEGLTPKQYAFARDLIFKYRKQIFGPNADTRQGKVQAMATVNTWFPMPLCQH